MLKSLKTQGILIFATLLAVFASDLVVQAQCSSDGTGTVKVMTYNLFQGTDFVEVLSAQSFPEYLAAAQLTLNEVMASNPPLRMQAIAHQITISRPDLVGLEEATLWRTGAGPNPTDVLYDPLQELLDALSRQGQHYAPVVVADEYELQGPLTADFSLWLRANGRNVLLARSDKPDMHLSNPQTGQSAAFSQFRIPFSEI